MDKEDRTTRIFTGSAIEAQPLIISLQEIDINPIIRDDHQSGITSGFATGVPGQIRVFIWNDELAIAQSIIDEHLKLLEE